MKSNSECRILVLPSNESIYKEKGTLLLDALASGNHSVSADCGGRGTCGKCRVKLLSGSVAGASVDSDGYVLACRATIIEDITVFYGDSLHGGLEDMKASFTSLDKKSGLGIALDIGTTTVAACLVDLESGEITKKTSSLNPQRSFGADVLSRIQASNEGKLFMLRDAIVAETKRIIDLLSDGKPVEELVISANTTMLHLFLGVDPASIGVSPFVAAFLDSRELSGCDIGLPVSRVTLLPSASAYIGSDVVSGVVSTDLDQDKRINMLIDIGTNGEIVISVGGKLYAASTAAGPALEGASIECGVGGISGAIKKVSVNYGELDISTIDDASPVGICGSGLIDAMAILVSQGLVDECGNFDYDCDSPLSARLVDDKFYLTDKIYISKADIRQIQLAKSALRSGINTLFVMSGINADRVDSYYIAGGLGYYMSVESAITVGLLPPECKGRVEISGNTSLSGAIEAMLSSRKLDKAKSVAKMIEIIDLAGSSYFQNEFINNIYFNI